MSQPNDRIEQNGPNHIVRVSTDSNTDLDKLFKTSLQPNDNVQKSSLPMRMRNFPASFFRQPERGSKSANHSRESSADSTFSSQAPVPQNPATSLPVCHSRAHSSPASLQQTTSVEPPLPPGWDIGKTPSGQRYFINHSTQTTQWQDPRLVASIVENTPLPKGWEKSITPEGEVYFINHTERTTSWTDPRLSHVSAMLQANCTLNRHQQQPPPAAPSRGPQSSPNMVPPPPPSINALTQQQQQQQQQQSATMAALNLEHLSQIRGLNTDQLQVTQTSPLLLASPPSNTQITLQSQQQRLQKLKLERENLRIRQKEILGQKGTPILNEMLMQRSITEEVPSSPPEIQTDPFLSDFHSRQESADSGLGLGPFNSMPHTPEDFLAGVDDSSSMEGVLSQGELCIAGTPMDIGTESMDSDDLVPSLQIGLFQEELNADILSDVDCYLSAEKENVLTWL